MDWAEALLLECQVPLKDLSAALSFKCPYYQIDVWFGLPKRKDAGESHRDALHEPLWFCDQGDVDEFVNLIKEPINKFDVCCILYYY